MKRNLLLICAMIAATLNAVSQDNPGKSGSHTYAPVTLPNTELRPFHSTILNQDMLIYIKLPVSYSKNPQKIYPALYMIDANYGFPMVANFLSLYEIPGTSQPEICLVGIGYKIDSFSESFNQWSAWRTRDLTPPIPKRPAADSAKSQEETGGAGKFLEFLAKEVFPFVESNYRISTTGRGLAGYSYGGLFSLYVLLKEPELG